MSQCKSTTTYKWQHKTSADTFRCRLPQNHIGLCNQTTPDGALSWRGLGIFAWPRYEITNAP